MVADGEDADIRPRRQHLAHGLGIDGVVVGHLDLDEFAAMTCRPETEPLAVFAGGEVEHHVVGANQGGRGRFEAEHRLALEDHRRPVGTQRVGRLQNGRFVELLKGGIEVVGDGPRERPQDHRVRVDRSRAERDDRRIVVEVAHVDGPLKALPEHKDTSSGRLSQGGAECWIRCPRPARFAQAGRHGDGL